MWRSNSRREIEGSGSMTEPRSEAVAFSLVPGEMHAPPGTILRGPEPSEEVRNHFHSTGRNYVRTKFVVRAARPHHEKGARRLRQSTNANSLAASSTWAYFSQA